MNNTQLLTYILLAALVAFGMYRKEYTREMITSDDPYEQVVAPGQLNSQFIGSARTIQSKTQNIGKVQIAQLAHKLEKQLDDDETIIQVHDYTNESIPSGLKHTFDITTFNSRTTGALTKRVQCLQAQERVNILSMELISPITGSIMTQRDLSNDISDLLLDDVDDKGDNDDAKFIRDQYTFVRKADILPAEPLRLSEHCTKSLRESPDTLTPECSRRIEEYNQEMSDYRRQVAESRSGSGDFTQKRRVSFAPASESIQENEKFPFSHPQTYGFVAHEEAPVDYSVLSEIKPLKDEQFFNTIAMENSSLAIQYG
jgi:HPt (histidine-containing phosphotransfer) domain-containing protein